MSTSPPIAIPRPTSPRYRRISVFDAGGARVFRDTADGDEYIWEVVNSSGLTLASGIYLYTLKTPDGALTTGKLAVIR